MRDQLLVRLRDASDISIVGGKASALGTMLRTGFRVPDGFVLPAKAFNKMTPQLENVLMHSFDELDARFVAVRSSAINEDGIDAAWAGQLDTFLNCIRNELVQKVKSCWKSVNTERAQSYALQKGIKSSRIAVIVQEMIDSDISGVAFSAHPVSGNEALVVIEAGLGLGEAVVSGEITPDTYIVNKEDGQLAEKHVAMQKRMRIKSEAGENIWEDVGDKGSAQKLSAEQIDDVYKLTVKLEKFFAYPVDVEWAIKGNTLYVLQCRPITTLLHP